MSKYIKDIENKVSVNVENTVACRYRINGS